jgi:hypothetical protein
MSQPLNFVLLTEEKFDGSNWAKWKESIISVAKSRRVMGYFEGTIPRPPTPSSSDDPSAIPVLSMLTIYWGLKRPSQDEWEQWNVYTQGLSL